jgi:hypothetical protein
MSEQVIWEPQPGPQTALLQCPVFEVFFGGARGGASPMGCSETSPAMLISTAQMPFIRRELTQLKELIECSRQIFGPLGANFTDSKKMWRFLALDASC